jgi:hypothetical protein
MQLVLTHVLRTYVVCALFYFINLCMNLIFILVLLFRKIYTIYQNFSLYNTMSTY